MKKVIVAQVVTQYQLENQATHHAICILEAKFKILCKAQYGVFFQERTQDTQEA
jgi:hypothetical protein